MSPNSPKIALMIDADNKSSKNFQYILNLIPIGQIVHYFASGQESALKSWNEPIKKHHFKVVEAKGKDAADIAIEKECLALAIERPEIDTFCIVSDDKGYENAIKTLQRWGKKVVVIKQSDIEKNKNTSDVAPKTQQATPQKTAAPKLPKPQKSTQASEAKSPQQAAKKALSKTLPSALESKKLELSPKQNPEKIKKASNVAPKTQQVTPQNAVKRVLPPALPNSQQTQRLKALIEEAFDQLEREWVTVVQIEKALKTIDKTFREEDYGATSFTNLLLALPDFISYMEFKAADWVRLKKPITKNE